MHSYNKDIGSFGEALARDYLISKGYKILNMNFRNKFGEIDIICKKNNLLIFCEIKKNQNQWGGKVDSGFFFNIKILKRRRAGFLFRQYEKEKDFWKSLIGFYKLYYKG